MPTAAYMREYRKRPGVQDAQKVKGYNIKYRYGLSVEEYEALMLKGCAVCGTTEDLCVDHDHNCCSGKKSCGKCVRGALCNQHNWGEGYFPTIEEILGLLAYRISCENKLSRKER